MGEVPGLKAAKVNGRKGAPRSGRVRSGNARLPRESGCVESNVRSPNGRARERHKETTLSLEERGLLRNRQQA